jgi:hypothetical protein
MGEDGAEGEQVMTPEDLALVVEEAKTRRLICTYCRYNVDH